MRGLECAAAVVANPDMPDTPVTRELRGFRQNLDHTAAGAAGQHKIVSNCCDLATQGGRALERDIECHGVPPVRVYRPRIAGANRRFVANPRPIRESLEELAGNAQQMRLTRHTFPRLAVTSVTDQKCSVIGGGILATN